jgi:predicted transcriptional regulator
MSVNPNIKDQLLKEIESLTPQEQQTVLGVVENYIHNKADETEWALLPEAWKMRIDESLKQADNGQFILHEDAVKYIRKKYGLHE